MTTPTVAAIGRHLDALLRADDVPDFSGALNGIQVETDSPITKVAAAVDARERTIRAAAEAGANLLLVHHGLFWGGVQPLRGAFLRRIRLLLEHRIAIYSSHLPLDMHPELGNNVLLARELELVPEVGFARYKTIDIGVAGTSDVPTSELVARATRFAREHGHDVRTAGAVDGKVTRRWGICTGAGAGQDTLREAATVRSRHTHRRRRTSLDRHRCRRDGPNDHLRGSLCHGDAGRPRAGCARRYDVRPAVDLHRRTHGAVSDAALSLQSIVKRFGGVTALDGASLAVAPGTIHALLGENGAGKTTLMRIAYGLERPDAGIVQIGGETVTLHAATDAIERGVGMVQQHFSLVPAMTVAENVALGGRGRFHPRVAAERVRMLGHDTLLRVDPDARVADLPVAAQQKVELLKLFSREARTLILDEPTSVLAPSEARELMALLRRVANDGGAVVLVTHKLREALAVADEVTVLRRGRTVITMSARAISEDALARAMFPEGIAAESATPARQAPGQVIAELQDVELRDRRAVPRVRGVTLSVRAGEILGVAGVEGSGHHELLLALAGHLPPASGEIRIPSEIAFIPEHRQRDALIPAFSVIENVALRDAARTRGRMRWPMIATTCG